MNKLLQGAGGILLGILVALVSTAIVLGSISLAFKESISQIAFAPSATASLSPSITPTPLPPPATPLPGSPTFTPTAIPSTTPTATLPVPTNCIPPQGWVAILTGPGDTLSALAVEFETTVEALSAANCLTVGVLPPDSIFFVPPPPTATNTPKSPTQVPPTHAPCVVIRPPGWVLYTIRYGDTLYSLSIATGTTVSQLKAVNCLTSDLIHTGDHLYIPYVPVTPTPTRTERPTGTPTDTPIPPTATDTPPVIPPTSTPTPTKTLKPTHTPTPTETTPPPPTDTPTDTAEPPTDTPLPPTDTSIPPSETPVPPSDTPRPPTATVVPPNLKPTTVGFPSGSLLRALAVIGTFLLP